jgi:Mycolic acid cyclopropane synthetase
MRRRNAPSRRCTERDMRALLRSFLDRVVTRGTLEAASNTGPAFTVADGGCDAPPLDRADGWTKHRQSLDRQIDFSRRVPPALSEVLLVIERAGLMVTDNEILPLHYAETLKALCGQFQARRDDAKALYDECFCRMWELYLAACEVAFRYCKLMVFQIEHAAGGFTDPRRLRRPQSTAEGTRGLLPAE